MAIVRASILHTVFSLQSSGLGFDFTVDPQHLTTSSRRPGPKPQVLHPDLATLSYPTQLSTFGSTAEGSGSSFGCGAVRLRAGLANWDCWGVGDSIHGGPGFSQMTYRLLKLQYQFSLHVSSSE